MSGDKENGFNVARAELFEAMGHPNRIKIIKALEETPLGFSELKRAVGIESSGLLAFHLDKLTHLVATDSSGNYALTDEGREALKIIQTTTDESIHGNGKRGPRRIERRNVVLAAVVIAILVLATFAVYQQSELSGLSKSNSSQSSELVSPTMNLEFSNFTVIKVNATAAPVMFVNLWNDGQSVASSGSIFVGVSGQGSTFKSCYNSSATFPQFFPVYANSTSSVYSRLSCGDIGDRVVLTAQVNFLTSGQNVTKTLDANTTIVQPQFSRSTTTVVKQLGINSFVTPYDGTPRSYIWYLALTNEAASPVVSINATLSMGGRTLGVDSACIFTPGPPVGPVSRTAPLTKSASCQGAHNGGLIVLKNSLSFGLRLNVMISVTYMNGTVSNASTSALVLPPYVLLE